MALAPLSVLYVGPLWPGGTCLQRADVFRRLGHAVKEIDTDPTPQRKPLRARIAERLFRAGAELVRHADLADANRRIISALRERPFDLLWLDKGLTIGAETLREARRLRPRIIVAGYSPDDMGTRHNQSSQFLEALPLYDIYFTTKSFGVAELTALGCPRTVLVGNGFDPATHRPIPVTAAERSDFGGPVGFVGDWEATRARSMARLAQDGIPVRVWGSRWDRCRERHPLLRLELRPVRGDDYARAVASFDVVLCFLRKASRDFQTTRSVEIPACGGFMLAERTEEHLALFEEGREAAFFSSDEELLEKTRYYLDHSEERHEVARAGRERCLAGGYSNLDRLSRALEALGR